ncbi:glycosyltransferase family 2 protein [Phaeobacter sp. B1627]|uniref:glycosyltransferase family 2 protein n=1 Tax=Phaeobacter sp. B1627 TaxID=2583809 RepID=UPI0011186274|nr:glycosyltransferase family 2 protein [Phaeobacter sp. B1627]TNJ42732.1 glycosyltransferase family 2 protein [Phaeobacter sp. B1627]
MQGAVRPSTWGLVSTIKADAPDILDFAAWHLERGAHRLLLYLDAPCPDALPHLKAHPRIRVIETDRAHWQKRRGGMPQKHQVRQSLNATRAYRRQSADLDWLIHLDVDEFLWSEDDLAATLATLPEQVLCARARPLEALADGSDGFKAPIPPGPEQDRIAAHLYPRFASYLRGGFVSHVQGKLFVRTGQNDVDFRIHNAFVGGVENPGQQELPQVDLCHLHAATWTTWLAHYRYRLAKGSYRAELKPAQSREAGGVTLHQLLSSLEAESGESGLRSFFDEICADSPDLRNRLTKEGLFRRRTLAKLQARQRQFPKFG